MGVGVPLRPITLKPLPNNYNLELITVASFFTFN